MSEFALTSVFVVPVGNSLPTTGSTESLTLGQFGITKDPTMTAATAANIGTASYIQLVQGRPGTGNSTKRSDKIKSTKILQWYKVASEPLVTNEIWTVGGFTAKCDEQLSLTLRIHSAYSEVIDPNGITKVVTINTPCCNCGTDPCAFVTNEQVVDLFMAKIVSTINAQKDPNTIKLDTYLSFVKVGTGDSAVIQITGKALPTYTTAGDPTMNVYQYDRLWFRPFITKGTYTSQDFEVAHACDAVGVTTLVQRSSFPRGTSAEVKQAQIDFHSYQDLQKDYFSKDGYNQAFENYVTDGTFYDLYVIKFQELASDPGFNFGIALNEEVHIYSPANLSSGIETVLTAYLGAPVNESPVAQTTTTTTSTSSTSSTTSTTTTVQIP